MAYCHQEMSVPFGGRGVGETIHANFPLVLHNMVLHNVVVEGLSGGWTFLWWLNVYVVVERLFGG